MDKRVNMATLWLGWTLASALGLEAAFWVGQSTTGRLYFGLGLVGLDPSVRGIVLIPVKVAIWGLLLGLAQSLVLRRYLTGVGRWPAMSAIGSLLAAPVLTTSAALFHRMLSPSEALVYAGFTGCVFGFCIALVQLTVLRGKVGGSQIWLAAGFAGYGLGAICTIAISVFKAFPYELNNAAIGAIDGAITGAALMYLLGRPMVRMSVAVI